MDKRTWFAQSAADWQRYRGSRAYYWGHISRFVAFHVPPGASVLEVGCAAGDLLADLPGRQRTGIDFCPELIDQARQRFPDIDFHVMEAEHITLTQTFDVVILSNVIGYLDDVESVLRQVRGVCSPHSRVIINSYNRLWEPLIGLAEALHIKRRSPEQNWLSRGDLRNLLYLSGFEAYRDTSNMLLPFNVPLVAPLLNRVVAHLPLMGALTLDDYVYARPAPQAPPDWPTRHSVSVIVPARNEEGNIAEALRRIPDMGAWTEIIFVEGGSSDATWQRITELAPRSGRRVQCLQQTGHGKGDAVRQGFAAAQGDILMILDADLTVPPEDLPKFYEALATRKGEFVNGVRLVYPMQKGSMRTLNTLGNHLFSALFSWLLDTPVKDTLCGTKVMWRRDYQRLAAGRAFFGDFDPFGDFDLLFGAHKLNLRLVDLPIRYRERTYGATNISRFRHGLLLLRMCCYAASKLKFR